MTVKFTAVPNFSQLPAPQARDIVYNQLVPCCEAKGVHLSKYGNHASMRALHSQNFPHAMAEYSHNKSTNSLFNVDRIQRAFDFIRQNVSSTSKYQLRSYSMKHDVEKRQNEYLSNGDLIAAMLMNGYSARFAKRGEPLGVNCEFKAKVTAQHN